MSHLEYDIRYATLVATADIVNGGLTQPSLGQKQTRRARPGGSELLPKFSLRNEQRPAMDSGQAVPKMMVFENRIRVCF